MTLSPGAGALVAAGLAVGLPTAFLLRRRLPAAVVAALLSAGGVGLTLGVLLLEPGASTPEMVAALAIMGLMVPVHVRIVVGPFGPPR